MIKWYAKPVLLSNNTDAVAFLFLLSPKTNVHDIQGDIKYNSVFTVYLWNKVQQLH